MYIIHKSSKFPVMCRTSIHISTPMCMRCDGPSLGGTPSAYLQSSPDLQCPKRANVNDEQTCRYLTWKFTPNQILICSLWKDWVGGTQGKSFLFFIFTHLSTPSSFLFCFPLLDPLLVEETHSLQKPEKLAYNLPVFLLPTALVVVGAEARIPLGRLIWDLHF